MPMPVHSSAVSKMLERYRASSSAIPCLGQLDVLAALNQIGTRRCFHAGNEIYADGDLADCWYKVACAALSAQELITFDRLAISKLLFVSACGLCDAPPRLSDRLTPFVRLHQPFDFLLDLLKVERGARLHRRILD